MANGAKELRFDIVGNADKFGEAAKKVESYISELKKQGLDVLTAGVYTGGAAALASKTIDAIKAVVESIKGIIERAERLNISGSSAVRLQQIGSAVGIDVATLDAGVQQARVARSDALAGDDSAAKAFERLGISLEEIRDLKPDELFERILKTAESQTLDAERFFAYSKLISQNTAEAILPYARNPVASVNASRAIETIRSGQIGNTPGGMGKLLDNLSWMGVEPLQLLQQQMRSLRQPFEPFSPFGIAQRDQTEFMSEQNRQRMNLVSRSQLTTEERINEVVAERLRLVRLIEEEQDPLKRQKFIANSLNVEAELAGLVTKRESELRSAPGKATTDPLRAIGADFSRFSPTLATNLAQRQVEELQRLRATTEAGLSRIAQMLEN